jgi:hypothetical protein
MPGVPHPIPFRTRSLSPPGPMVLRLKARESRSPPGPLKGCSSQSSRSKVQTLPHDQNTTSFAAGWSSPVARQAHNLKVTGSNPVPAPNYQEWPPSGGHFRFCAQPLTRVSRAAAAVQALSPLSPPYGAGRRASLSHRDLKSARGGSSWSGPPPAELRYSDFTRSEPLDGPRSSTPHDPSARETAPARGIRRRSPRPTAA